MIFSVSFSAASEPKRCAALHGLCLWDRIASIAPTFRVPQFAYAAILILAAGASTLIVTQQPTGTGRQADGSADIPLAYCFEIRHNYRYASGLRTDRRVAALALCASVQAREQ